MAPKEATVSLLIHDLQDWQIAYMGKAANVFATIVKTSYGLVDLTSMFNDTKYKHWALLVEFKDEDYVYICELSVEINQNNHPQGSSAKPYSGLPIVGTCTRLPKKHALDERAATDIRPLGKVKTTPEKLKEMCNTHHLNKLEYHMLMRNCQNWVESLIDQLGLQMPSDVVGILNN